MPAILLDAEAKTKSSLSAIGLVKTSEILDNMLLLSLSCILIVSYIAGKLPHKYKIVIAGNHELSFDPTFTHPLTNKLPFQKGYEVDEIPTLGIPRQDMKEAVEKSSDIRDKLTNCIYLEDAHVTIYGVKIYGTPWYESTFTRLSTLFKFEDDFDAIQ